jgi:aspartate aminotransferase
MKKEERKIVFLISTRRQNMPWGFTMQLSKRILSVKTSPTVALNAKAKALAKEGHKVLNFTVGEPDFATPKPIVNVAVEALHGGKTKYGAAGGGVEIRQAICAKLKRENNLQFDLDQVVVGIGAKEILFHIFLAILNEGDEVLIPSPYWVSYPDQVIAAGAKPVALPMAEDPSRQLFDLASLDRCRTDRTTAIVLNSPCNPSGCVISEDLLHALGQYLEKTDWWIVADEIYEYLTFEGQHRSLLELFPKLKDRFILVNGMSKGYAMTGWRVGYCAAPTAPLNVAKLVRDLQSHSSTCLPPFIEDAATYALNQGQALLAQEIQDLKKRRDLTIAMLKELEAKDLGIVVPKPQGAFYLLLDLRSALNRRKASAFEFAEYLLSKHYMAVVPGEPFGAPGFIRISYATSQAQMAEGVGRLEKALKEWV